MVQRMLLWLAAILCAAAVWTHTESAGACSPLELTGAILSWPDAGQQYPANAPLTIIEHHDAVRVTVDGEPAQLVALDDDRYRVDPEPPPGAEVALWDMCFPHADVCDEPNSVAVLAGPRDEQAPEVPTLTFNAYQAPEVIPGSWDSCGGGHGEWTRHWRAEVTGVTSSPCDAAIELTVEIYADATSSEPFITETRDLNETDETFRFHTLQAVPDVARVCMRARAQDEAGNVSAWSELQCTACRAHVDTEPVADPFVFPMWSADDDVPGGFCGTAEPGPSDETCVDAIDHTPTPPSERKPGQDVVVHGRCAFTPSSSTSPWWVVCIVAAFAVRRRRT